MKGYNKIMNYKLERISYCFDDESEQYIVIYEGNNDIVAVAFRDVATKRFYKVSFVDSSLTAQKNILEVLSKND